MPSERSSTRKCTPWMCIGCGRCELLTNSQRSVVPSRARASIRSISKPSPDISQRGVPVVENIRSQRFVATGAGISSRGRSAAGTRPESARAPVTSNRSTAAVEPVPRPLTSWTWVPARQAPEVDHDVDPLGRRQRDRRA